MLGVSTAFAVPIDRVLRRDKLSLNGPSEAGLLGEQATTPQERANAVRAAFKFAWDGYYKLVLLPRTTLRLTQLT